MATDLRFVTGISAQTTKGLLLRGYPMTELIVEADFVSTIYLSIVGKKPSKQEKKILNAVFVAALELGLGPATAFVPRITASSGGDVLNALAVAILTLGPLHGGAVTGAMELFAEIALTPEEIEKNTDLLVQKILSEGGRIPGFGHATYKKSDPRTTALFEAVRSGTSIDMLYLNIARQVEHSIEQRLGKKHVLNIDGSIAALLLSINIPPAAGNCIFAVSRVAGAIAHGIEEQKQGLGVRRLRPQDIEYAADR